MTVETVVLLLRPPALTLQSKTLLVDTLSWSDEIWTIRAGEYPCLAWEIAE